jgi:hypothetical protein
MQSSGNALLMTFIVFASGFLIRPLIYTISKPSSNVDLFSSLTTKGNKPR